MASAALVKIEQGAKINTLTTVRFELTPFRTTELISKMEMGD